MKRSQGYLFLVGAVLTLVLLAGSGDLLAFKISRQTVSSAGNMWGATSTYQLCCSLGQSVCGCQQVSGTDLYSGFWNPWVVASYPLAAEDEAWSMLPRRYVLHQNYPNPFNPTTVITYALPRTSHVIISVYNLLGQRVRTLVDQSQSPGLQTVLWDGRDEAGSDVASGIYFYRIQAENFNQSKKMLLLK